MQGYCDLHGSSAVTCYVHIVACHSPTLLETVGSIGLYANQGAENAHKDLRRGLQHTSRGGGKTRPSAVKAVMMRHCRIATLHLLFDEMPASPEVDSTVETENSLAEDEMDDELDGDDDDSEDDLDAEHKLIRDAVGVKLEQLEARVKGEPSNKRKRA